MKQIEAFIDSVYQHTGGNKQEIQELKAEMTSHLLEAVHELKAEGKTEQEAIDIAIERFGEEKEMRSIVGQLFNVQKTFAKWVLYTSIAFLLICSIISGIIFNTENQKLTANNQFASQLLDKLGDKKEIPTQMIEDIQSIVENSESIYGISIYEYENLFTTEGSREATYSFREKLVFNDWLLVTYNGYGENNGTWHIDIDSKSYEATALAILLLGFSIYWALFTIWAIINAYHQRRLHFGWIIVFALFNIVGYLIFRLAGKRSFAR